MVDQTHWIDFMRATMRYRGELEHEPQLRGSIGLVKQLKVMQTRSKAEKYTINSVIRKLE
jgi:hypothetical protein